jgi:hypothetical protein
MIENGSLVKSVLSRTFLKTYIRGVQDVESSFPDNLRIGQGAHGTVYSRDGRIFKLQDMNPDIFRGQHNNPAFRFTSKDLFVFLKEKGLIVLMDQGVGEALVMNTIQSPLLTSLADFFIYFSPKQGVWRTCIEMSSKVGPSYRSYFSEHLQKNPKKNLELLLDLFRNMKRDLEKHNFVHGDLQMDNIRVVDCDYGKCLQFIDFGLSSFTIKKGRKTYKCLPANTYNRLSNTHKDVNLIHSNIELRNLSAEEKQKIKDGVYYNQSVDVCKLLQHYYNFRKEYDEKLDGCIGHRISRKQARLQSPHHPVYSAVLVHSLQNLSYDEAIKELENEIARLKENKVGGTKKRTLK